MSKTRREVNSFYHGPVDLGTGNSADYVAAHGERRGQRGNPPSVPYDGENNPRLALARAQYHLNLRALDDDGSEGYGRVGIKAQEGSLPIYSKKLKWLGSNGLVGVKHVESDVPHLPLRRVDYIPNTDGTVAITKPDEKEIERRRTVDTYMETHLEANWVMVGNTTGEVYGGGTDAQTIGEEAYAALEATVGEKVHLYGRPTGIGLDGATPVFPE